MVTPQDVLPFIVGSGRCGSTLLRVMLNCHPALGVTPEARFVRPMLEQRGRYELGGRFRRRAFVDDLLAHESFREWRLDRASVEAALEEETAADLSGALRSVMSLWARRQGKRRYGNQTPRLVRALPLVAAGFPEARFVHLIRDGRDTALSRVGWDIEPTVAAAIGHWRRSVADGQQHGAALGPDRYLEVRYEELVAQPAAVLRQVSRFVGLDFHPAMLRHHENLDREVLGIGADIQTKLDMPLTPGLRDWRTQMPVRDQAICELIAGDLLHELGYPRGPRRRIRARVYLRTGPFKARLRRWARPGRR